MTPSEWETLRLLATETGTRVLVALGLVWLPWFWSGIRLLRRKL